MLNRISTEHHVTPTLADSFGRRIEYLRVSVTDRCNFHCFYCMPQSGIERGQHREFLTFEEMERVIRVFTELGVYRVRLTGGEPLVRRNILDFIKMLGSLPAITDFSLSTNGHLLERFAAALKKAGVMRVNVSIDSLDPKTFTQITRGGDLAGVLRGIDAALEAGLKPVKLNMVVMKGVNDAEIEPMIEFAMTRGADLRLIETMPVGSAGVESMAYYYPASGILERIRNKFGADPIPAEQGDGAGPARYYRVGAGPSKIGLISAMSRHFCEACNRVRLTTRGELVLCLGRKDRISLRDLVRAGCSDAELREAIRAAIREKPESHDFSKASGERNLIAMAAIGG